MGVQFGDAPKEMLEAAQSFLAMDAPRHTKLRKLVSSTFTPRQIARIEDAMNASAKQIVEEIGPTGGGDFVDLVAKKLPLQTISDMIGVPEADRPRVVKAADTPPIEITIDPMSSGDPVNGSDAVFAAVAAATWIGRGLPPAWPTG